MIYGVFSLVGTGALFAVLIPKFDKLARLEEQRDEMLQKISEKKKAIEALKVMQNRFENDANFVEYIARQNKRIRKHEFIFIGVDD